MNPFLVGPLADRISSARASNEKWILVQAEHGYNALHAVTDGGFVLTLPAALSHSAQVVFTRDLRPTFDWLLYVPVGGNSVTAYNVMTEEYETLATFTEYSKFAANRAEGDLSETGKLALSGVRVEDNVEEVFLFDVGLRTKGAVYTENGPWDGIKAGGNNLIRSKESGIYNLTTGQQLSTVNGHAAVNANYLAWCSNARPKPWRNAVELVSVADPSDSRVLKDFGKLNYAMHLSMGPDAVICSVYDPSDALLNQIWSLPYKGGEELLHEWRAPYRKDFEPRATISSDGTLILYNVPDGDTCNVWGLRRDRVLVPVVETPSMPGTRVDYSSFVGVKYWEMWPRPDGGLDIIEKLVKP